MRSRTRGLTCALQQCQSYQPSVDGECCAMRTESTKCCIYPYFQDFFLPLMDVILHFFFFFFFYRVTVVPNEAKLSPQTGIGKLSWTEVNGNPTEPTPCFLSILVERCQRWDQPKSTKSFGCFEVFWSRGLTSCVVTTGKMRKRSLGAQAWPREQVTKQWIGGERKQRRSESSGAMDKWKTGKQVGAEEYTIIPS